MQWEPSSILIARWFSKYGSGSALFSIALSIAMFSGNATIILRLFVLSTCFASIDGECTQFGKRSTARLSRNV